MNELTAVNLSDKSLVEEGAKRIKWAESQMPVLMAIRDRFLKEKPFEGLRIAMCMHITTETAALIRTVSAGGAKIHVCASNPLSTQDDVVSYLNEVDHIPVFAKSGVDRETYYHHIDQSLAIAPHFVFDDGCDLVTRLHTEHKELLVNVKGGCEETTTGVVRLRRMAEAGQLLFPMIAVNDTDTKRMFDNRYGTGQSSLDAIMRATNILFAGKIVVVAGYGYCGKGVAQRAAGLGAQVIVTEIDPKKALDALMQGYRVMPMAHAASLGDVFITVTGNCSVLTDKHFLAMKDDAILANAGHFDVEVDVKGLRCLAVSSKRDIRHRTEQFNLPNGKNVYLVAEGRLVNLAAAEGHPASVMDMSFSDQALAAKWLVQNVNNLPAEVVDVPSEIDEEVASLKLKSTGVAIDTLTDQQLDYINSWDSGS
ncbi:adenosylhomocysteinase [Gluconacetobacter entanii]|uniref:adenosylhomocysteinase n=1 Tax=Gluconacetobacter entanii TaxID=108528 RepID=UPI001C93243D|nr:adenosylhomocysteinase [Gluconacetobacter entanii]MBY4640950.1 adenosylhomocysteinase [Gluconacetobacter entanii]MCW4579039.1 adenosylhomocysteinase [Gluconacetobacter entanii]MCW4582439.1 adenosylhomocysteinase [Gluconacetobacter entanii]MCW4585830.1 adenosylhomocysteinase [Gluconacetobacter entanii]